MLGRLALLLMRHLRELRDEPARLAELLASVADLIRLLPRQGDRVLTFCYIMGVVEKDVEAVTLALGDVGREFREDVVTAADQLRREGERRGLLLGQRRLLVHLLRTRFGQLSPAAEQRIDAADEATLTVWAERVLTASSVEDVLGLV